MSYENPGADVFERIRDLPTRLLLLVIIMVVVALAVMLTEASEDADGWATSTTTLTRSSGYYSGYVTYSTSTGDHSKSDWYYYSSSWYRYHLFQSSRSSTIERRGWFAIYIGGYDERTNVNTIQVRLLADSGTGTGSWSFYHFPPGMDPRTTDAQSLFDNMLDDWCDTVTIYDYTYPIRYTVDLEDENMEELRKMGKDYMFIAVRARLNEHGYFYLDFWRSGQSTVYSEASISYDDQAPPTPVLNSLSQYQGGIYVRPSWRAVIVVPKGIWVSPGDTGTKNA